MARKKKNLLQSIKEAISPKEEPVVEEVENITEPTEEDFLSNEETLEELSNGKGEDDELEEPLADEQGE